MDEVIWILVLITAVPAKNVNVFIIYTSIPGRTKIYRTPRSWHPLVHLALPKN